MVSYRSLDIDLGDAFPSWLEDGRTRWERQPSEPTLKRGRLVWPETKFHMFPSWHSGSWASGGGEFVTPPRDLLARFIRLRDGDDSAVLEFARKWGPLPWCWEHSLPTPHSRECHAALCYERRSYWEPASAYREIARDFARVVTAAERALVNPDGEAALLAGAELWKIIIPAMSRSQRHAEESARACGLKRSIVQVANSWLIPRFGIAPSLAWDQSSDFASLGFSPLDPCLITTLARRVLGRFMSPLHHCSGCQREYSEGDRYRAPKRGQRNFCPECRVNRVPQRFAEREYRLRLKEKKPSAKRGKGVRNAARKA